MKRAERRMAIVAAAVLLAAAATVSAANLTLTLNKSKIKPGEAITVTFSEPLPKEGERYWITICPAGAADSEWGQWQYVDAGVKELVLTGPTTSGPYEVRLHHKYPAKSYHVICRKSLQVTGGSGEALSFTLAKSLISAGERPRVIFSKPLPKSGERYWITVCPTGSPDSEWGQWQYVDAGVKEIELEAVSSAGSYEVRLHDRYPELSYHVVFRLPLTVK